MNQGRFRSALQGTFGIGRHAQRPDSSGGGGLPVSLLTSGVALWLLIGTAGATNADDFVIEDDVTVTNGGHTVNGNDSLTITETGSIWTTGFGINAIGVSGPGDAIINWGTVRTDGERANGIRLSGSSNVVRNYGTIMSTGRFGFSLYLTNIDTTVDNYGLITTSGFNGTGIWLNSRGGDAVDGDHVVRNWGAIRTSGIGILANSPDNRIENYGTIISRNRAISISANNTVINWGDIWGEGPNAAVVLFGGSNELTNGGKIVHPSLGSILFNGRDNEFILLDQSYLGGQIDLGGSTSVEVQTAPSHSVLWDFSRGNIDGGAPTVSGPVPAFYNGDTFEYATFDPTALAGTVNQFGHMQGLLSSVGRSGLDRGESAPMQVADSNGQTVGGGGALPWDGRLWAGGFGGFYEHDGNSTTLDRDIDLHGFAVGYGARPAAGLTVSAMVGYLWGSQEAESRWAPSYDLDSKAVFAGANGRMRVGLFDIDVGLAGGHVRYNSDRFVNDNLAPLGEAWSSASYGAWFVSPEVGVSAVLDWTNVISVRPSARLAYAHQSIASYQEAGSNAAAYVDRRELSLLIGTAELSVERQLSDIVTVNAVGGYTKRLNVGDDAVSVHLIGETNDVDFGDTDSAAFYAGGGFSVDIGDNVNLAVEARTFLNGDFSGTEGHAKLSITF